MLETTHIPAPGELQRTYATLRVIDGAREIKPTHVAFDHIRFAHPPILTSAEVLIVLTNGDQVQRQVATVLPHATAATLIPIILHPLGSE
jgi:hypothetical protein